MKRCLILVEGQTEERFVKDVLSPHFEPLGLFIYPTILTTKVVKSGKDFKGGVTKYSKLRGDLIKLLGDGTAPSKRLMKVFPSFRKTLHGPTAAKRIGLAAIRLRCPHFDGWISKLEVISRS